MRVFKVNKNGEKVEMNTTELQQFLKRHKIVVEPCRHVKGRGEYEKLNTEFDFGTYTSVKAQHHAHAQVPEIAHCLQWALKQHLGEPYRIAVMRSFFNALSYSNYQLDEELVKKACGDWFKPNPHLGVPQKNEADDKLKDMMRMEGEEFIDTTERAIMCLRNGWATVNGDMSICWNEGGLNKYLEYLHGLNDPLDDEE